MILYNKIRKSISVFSLALILVLFCVSNVQASLSSASTPTSIDNAIITSEEYGIKCWIVGKVTKRLLKEETDLSRKQIKQIRDVVVELCNELDK
jgi:hypothetical protein